MRRVPRTSERIARLRTPGKLREAQRRPGVQEKLRSSILASRRNGTLYIGVTNDLSRRIGEHKMGVVPGFTRRYGVHRLVYCEEYPSILEARAREHALKHRRRKWKIELIEKLNPTWRDLTDDLVNL